MAFVGFLWFFGLCSGAYSCEAWVVMTTVFWLFRSRGWV